MNFVLSIAWTTKNTCSSLKLVGFVYRKSYFMHHTEFNQYQDVYDSKYLHIFSLFL